MSDTSHHLTLPEFTQRLPTGDVIHTIRQAESTLLGAHWSREDLLAHAALHQDHLELTGPIATRMGHGLLIREPDGILFVAHAEETP